MKIAVALVLFVAVAQASLIPRPHLIPRNIDLPLSALNPRHTAAEWDEIYRQQEFQPEVVSNYKPGTVPQDADAGKVHVQVDEKIVGGSEAASGQFPWQVSITMDSSYFCGGSIISNVWVLTAGHCVVDVKSFRLVFGSLTPDGGESGTVAQTSRTSILHEDYDANLIINDIGLIQLSTPLTLSSLIGVVRLPSRSQEETTFAGENASVSGWGRSSDSETSISPELRYVVLAVIENTDCAKVWGTSIRASSICTSGAGGKSTCNGDSGGALVYLESDGKSTQVGIVSFGLAISCELGFPAAYTRVSSYLDFIANYTDIAINE